MNTPPLSTQEITDRKESIEVALVAIAQRILSPDFSQILRERIANGHDLEYKIAIIKRGNDYSVLFSYLRRNPTRPILSFNEVQ
ncbi:MAG: hypothetical protein WDM76_11835 [Limisphaerales bacterium]